jgi:hypothetical protein
MSDAKKQSKYVSNEELFAPLQAAFDKQEKKKAEEKAEKDKLDKELTGNAATRTRLNMGNLPGKAAAKKLNMQDATDVEKRNAAAYLRKGFSDEDAKEMSKQKAFKKGGVVKSSASKRADGCAVKGKTKGRMV